MKKLLISTLILLALLLAGCGDSSPDKHIVAATTAPLYEFVGALCEGTNIEVRLIVSEPVSCLHDYSLTVGQMRTVCESDCVFLSGAGLEEFMEDALDSAAATVDCSRGVALRELCEEGPGHGHDHEHAHEYDPHIWLSPENAAVMVENAADGLSALYPQWQDRFEENEESLLEELAALQEYGETALSSLPRRGIITFHDGFAYFADAFGLEILASFEEESGSEASAAAMSQIAELVESLDLPAVFTEENGSDAAAKAISRETGCEIRTLSTALSGDYFEIMRKNIDTIKEVME